VLQTLSLSPTSTSLGLSPFLHISAVPEEIQRRVPTTDTYSLGVPGEFFFSSAMTRWIMPLQKTRGPSATIAPAIGPSMKQRVTHIELVEAKRKSSRYPPLRPSLVQPSTEIMTSGDKSGFLCEPVPDSAMFSLSTNEILAPPTLTQSRAHTVKFTRFFWRESPQTAERWLLPCQKDSIHTWLRSASPIGEVS